VSRNQRYADSPVHTLRMAEAAPPPAASGFTLEPCAEIQDLLLGAYESLANGDYAFMESIISPQEIVLGVGAAPDEWWADHLSLSRALRTWVAGLAGATFVPGPVQAHREGSVGWLADRPTVRFPDGTGTSFRLTAVCHRENGAWKFVQWHISLSAAWRTVP
jgi:hypothetical protein